MINRRQSAAVDCCCEERPDERIGLLADLLMSRAASSVVAGINPLKPKQAVPQEAPTGGPLGVINSKPMPQWPFPPPVWSPLR
jgi:hypothetical protein